jgi:hypothetical protein
MQHGVIKERGGYALYVNGQFIMWCKYLRDLKNNSKQVPVNVKYSDTKSVVHYMDYSRHAK